MNETTLEHNFTPDEIVWPDYTEDPLWKVFKHGIPTSDPYNALLITICKDEYLKNQSKGKAALDKWFEKERWRGKRAWLALAYGSKAKSLAPALKWSVEDTQKAIDALEKTYAMLPAMRHLVLKEVLHLGRVQTLWGRERRLNGFFQLAGTEPVRIRFHYAIDLGNKRPMQAMLGACAGCEIG